MRTLAVGLFTAVVSFAGGLAAQEAEEDPKGEPGPAVAEYVVDGGRLLAIRGEERSPVELPATVMAAHRVGERLYVALGEHGAAVLELGGDPAAPVLAKRFPVAHGRVVGFLEIDGAVWMRIESTAAVLLEGGVEGGDAVVVIPGPGTGGAMAAQATGSKRKDLGRPVRIVEIHRDRGEVVLDVGARDGVEIGDRFVAYRELEGVEEKADAFAGQAEVADLEVRAVGPETALATLWRGDRVRAADEVRPAEPDRSPSRAYPRHMDRVGELALTVRPLFNVGNEKGFGMLCDVALAWWGRNWFIDLRMQPLGFGWTDDGNVLSTSLLAEAGFDGRAFAIGLGAGAAVVNGDLGENLVNDSVYEVASDAGSGVEAKWADRTRAAFALSQVVRLGARDGFNITLQNLLLYYDPPKGGGEDYENNKAGFYYGGTTGRITIPLAMRVNMFLGGGGGLVGYFFSEIGVFVWARGNGDAGSLGFTAAGGFAGIWGNLEGQNDEYGTNNVSILGPMISLGLTYRFGQDEG
ncbi:MAG TPA: hypothetical protein VM285_09145 [Polyangia bacterium]|nr:hypothetical protein [Polyangia bacterium]